MRHRLLTFAALVLFLLIIGPAVNAEAASGRVLVLDSKALVVRDIATGASLASVPIEGTPDLVVLTPDGRRAIVLDVYGDAKQVGTGGLTVVDLAEMRVLGRVPLKANPPANVAFGLPRVAGLNVITAAVHRWITPDSHWLVMPTPRVDNKKPELRAAPELVVVNLETGQRVGALALERSAALVHICSGGKKAVVVWARETPKNLPVVPAEAALVDIATATMSPRVTLAGDPRTVLATPESTTAIFLAGRLTPKKAPVVPASLQLLDLATGQAAAPMALEGAPASAQLSSDGAWLYLVDPGQPSSKREKNVDGRLHMFSTASGTIVATVPVGSGPGGLITDTEGGQAFLLSQRTPTAGTTPAGELRVLRGGEVVKTVLVGSAPEFVHTTDSRDRLYVISRDVVHVVGLPSFEVLGQMALGRPGGAALTGFDTTSDGQRAFALFALSSRLSVLDCAAFKHLASLPTGRGGIKFLKELGAMAASVGVGLVTPMYMAPVIYQPKAPNTDMAIGPDNKFVYVLNTQTNDITVVDARAATSLSRLPAAGGRVQMLPGGKRLAVVAQDAIHLIDTEQNVDAGDLKFERSLGLGLWVVLSADGHDGLVAGPMNGMFIDPTTGQVRAKLEFTGEIRHVVMLPVPKG
jgi:DNA-binding beta-propeller fold protein YncE